MKKQILSMRTWNISSRVSASKTGYFLHLGDALCPKCLKVIDTYVHTLMTVAAMQGADLTSGAVGGSVSCPRTRWYADQGNRTSDLPITTCKSQGCPTFYAKTQSFSKTRQVFYVPNKIKPSSQHMINYLKKTKNKTLTLKNTTSTNQ